MEEYDMHAEFFEDFIPDDATCVSVKMLLNKEEIEEVTEEGILVRHRLNIIRIFLMEKYFQGHTVYAFSSGLHMRGKSKKPHIHMHFIVSQIDKPSNISRDKNSWLSKNAPGVNGADYSFHWEVLDPSHPKYQWLSYPLKEKKRVTLLKEHYYLDNAPMPTEYIRFLENVGNEIYSKAHAMKLRVEKADERKITKLHHLRELCEANRDKFSTYREMMKWLDVAFIHTLKIEEKPNPKNYKDMCFIVANTLGLVEYSDICTF